MSEKFDIIATNSDGEIIEAIGQAEIGNMELLFKGDLFVFDKVKGKMRFIQIGQVYKPKEQK